MKVMTELTDAHVGKFMVVRADQRSIPVQIISVGGDRVGWMVLDKNQFLLSGKSRFDSNQKVNIYDTAEEAINWEKDNG